MNDGKYSKRGVLFFLEHVRLSLIASGAKKGMALHMSDNRMLCDNR
jgi:hypothetical protein